MTSSLVGDINHHYDNNDNNAVAEMAAERKLAKYSNLASNFIFQPIAAENLGAFSLSTLDTR